MYNLLVPSEIREINRRYHKNVKKSLGQNYLINAGVVDKITNKILELSSKYQLDLIEIGPGLGALSQKVLTQKKLTAIETDSHSIKILQEELSKQTQLHPLKIIHQNILNYYHLPSSDKSYLIFGNLPYNIASSILFHSFNHFLKKTKYLIYMMQKEVGDRICNHRGLISLLSFISHFYCDKIEKLCDIKSGSYYPSPKVDSTVLIFQLKKQTQGDEVIFKKISKAIFNYRRKKIKKSLSLNGLDYFIPYINKYYPEMLDQRPEEIKIKKFIELSRKIAESKK